MRTKSLFLKTSQNAWRLYVVEQIQLPVLEVCGQAANGIRSQ